jgi:catechol 2,3-dioxygenase-like lactoylglutathione lyase family enzyme
VRVGHIGICVSDWKRSLRFYHDVLGFRYVYEREAKGEPSDTLLRLTGVSLREVYLEREGVRLALRCFDSPAYTGDGQPRPMNQLGLSHLTLRVGDLDATLAEMEAAGVRVLRDTRIQVPAARSQAAFITDPDGTLIELVQQPGD